jgi:hypothetical protein
MNRLIQVITSDDDAIRNQSLDSCCASAGLEQLLAGTSQLDQFWRRSDNLYQRVRSLLFLSAIYRFHVPQRLSWRNFSLIPFESYRHLLERRFREAIDTLLECQRANGLSEGLASALGQAYRELAFQTLADQVRRSVRTVRGNQWMFRVGHPADHPLRLRRELLKRVPGSPCFPVLAEKTAVRMDFSHSGWSDIFFLGMDFPAGARVINASIDLGVRGRDPHPRPPIETYLRVIDVPVLRLTSVDLKSSADIQLIGDVFDFARDYLGLLKAAIIASAIVPPGMEGCQQGIDELLERLVGPGLGLEIVSKVNDIPKGSRLAVSTNLLGSLISICMRATEQVGSLTGALGEGDRRLIAARAILGEWIGGSGGGWQDSGGIWPGIKLITGAVAAEGDPEFGISRGRLLPNHEVFSEAEVTPQTRQKLQDSLVLVHGGMAQNVGPILEMVTEKYLLRSPAEWAGRQEAIGILDEIIGHLRTGQIRQIGAATHRNFHGPLQTIIPWCTNLYTSTLIELTQQRFGEDFWGFWMLGGMAGGGMGFIFNPDVKPVAQDHLAETMQRLKSEMEFSLPFAIQPVVYDFSINDRGSWAELLDPRGAQMPIEYYALAMPAWLRSGNLSATNRYELEQLESSSRDDERSPGLRRWMASILPPTPSADLQRIALAELLDRHGFDREQHEQIRSDLRSGRIGLAQNRLPPSTTIDDVARDEILDARAGLTQHMADIGRDAIAGGHVAVVTLAAGVGSRWTEGAGVVKGLHPFCSFSGRHRSFIEVHLAKSRRVGQSFGRYIPHIITTGYLTHDPIDRYVTLCKNYGYPGQVVLSSGRAVGLRMVPMVRDLQFEWQEVRQKILDEQQEKMRASMRSALMNWAREQGEGSDYTDNLPLQCLHPVGHWFEVSNLLRNGLLRQLLEEQPQLEYLMLHNIDTLGANLDASLLGLHIEQGNCLTFEVIARRLEDRGGGLARVNGQIRLLEGLAMPTEEDEFRLSFYNSMTTWIRISALLGVFGLRQDQLGDAQLVDEAVRRIAARMPTYITIKDVKKRWGHGQEDVYPVSQFEKLWGDMTTLPQAKCGFVIVPLMRGQQLKNQAQLDGWLRDGSAAYVNELCAW